MAKAATGYDLCGCIVLAAAICATRRAYEVAMDLLPRARRLQGRRESEAMDLSRAPECTGAKVLRHVGLLDWARAKVATGMALPGVIAQTKRRGQHAPRGVVRQRILSELMDRPLSAKELAEVCGTTPTGIHQHLKALYRSGHVLDDLVGSKPSSQVGPPPKLWRLVEGRAA